MWERQIEVGAAISALNGANSDTLLAVGALVHPAWFQGGFQLLLSHLDWQPLPTTKAIVSDLHLYTIRICGNRGLASALSGTMWKAMSPSTYILRDTPTAQACTSTSRNVAPPFASW
jgi:hypothetical protein